MSATIAMFVIGLLASSYLVYRYMRYNPWTRSWIGRGFVLMKTALLAFFAHALLVSAVPDWEFRQEARFLLVGYADLAVLLQTWVVVQSQGGLTRRKPIPEDMAGVSTQQPERPNRRDSVS